ncbi:MAG: DUF4190 domain-containing protein [Ruminococcus sp.]|nr:DUF4190 domain-containing protein [Ruminococcus sp.]MDD6531890.1 DUF4190 domain-containing protein [Ruminococcus sp.]
MDENFNNQQNNQQNNQYNQQNEQYNQQYNQPQYNQQQYNQQYNQQQYNQPNNYNNYNNYAPNQYQQPQDNSRGLAIASLVLGIVSFFCCGSVCSIVGIVLGVLSRKKKPTDNGMATAGIVLSIIALAIWAIYFIYVLVVYGSFSAVYNTSRYYY